MPAPLRFLVGGKEDSNSSQVPQQPGTTRRDHCGRHLQMASAADRSRCRDTPWTTAWDSPQLRVEHSLEECLREQLEWTRANRDRHLHGCPSAWVIPCAGWVRDRSLSRCHRWEKCLRNCLRGLVPSGGGMQVMASVHGQQPVVHVKQSKAVDGYAAAVRDHFRPQQRGLIAKIGIGTWQAGKSASDVIGLTFAPSHSPPKTGVCVTLAAFPAIVACNVLVRYVASSDAMWNPRAKRRNP
jgi:hypothetical protein